MPSPRSQQQQRRRRKSMPLAALSNLEENSDGLKGEPSENSTGNSNGVHNSKRHGDKYRRASMAASMFGKPSSLASSGVEDKENSSNGNMNKHSGPEKTPEEIAKEDERRKRRQSRKSLGRRVSFAPTAHIRMFETQAEEAPQSPPKRDRSEWQWDSDDTDDTISAMSKASSKNMFEIPNVSSDGSGDKHGGLDLGLSLDSTNHSDQFDNKPSKRDNEENASFDVSIQGLSDGSIGPANASNAASTIDVDVQGSVVEPDPYHEGENFKSKSHYRSSSEDSVSMDITEVLQRSPYKHDDRSDTSDDVSFNDSHNDDTMDDSLADMDMTACLGEVTKQQADTLLNQYVLEDESLHQGEQEPEGIPSLLNEIISESKGYQMPIGSGSDTESEAGDHDDTQAVTMELTRINIDRDVDSQTPLPGRYYNEDDNESGIQEEDEIKGSHDEKTVEMDLTMPLRNVIDMQDVMSNGEDISEAKEASRDGYDVESASIDRSSPNIEVSAAVFNTNSEESEKIDSHHDPDKVKVEPNERFTSQGFMTTIEEEPESQTVHTRSMKFPTTKPESDDAMMEVKGKGQISPQSEPEKKGITLSEKLGLHFITWNQFIDLSSLSVFSFVDNYNDAVSVDQPTLSDELPENEYVSSRLVDVPESEAYYMIAKQLKKRLSESIDAINRLEKSFSDNNPGTIMDYLLAEEPERLQLESGYRRLLQKSKQDAASSVHGWGQKIIEKLNLGFQETAKFLDLEKHQVKDRSQATQKSTLELEQEKDALEQKIAEIRIHLEQELIAEKQEVKRLSEELNFESQSLADLKNKSEEVGRQGEMLSNDFSELLQRENTMVREIEEAKQVCAVNRFLTWDGVSDLKKQALLMGTAIRLNPVFVSRGEFSVEYNNSIVISISQKEDAGGSDISIKPIDNHRVESILGNSQDWKVACSIINDINAKIATTTGTLKERSCLAMRYWNQVHALLKEVQNVRLHTPVVMSYESAMSQPLVIRILFFSPRARIRFYLRFWLRVPLANHSWPLNCNIFSSNTPWDIELVYGNINISTLSTAIASFMNSASKQSPGSSESLASIFTEVNSWAEQQLFV
ncbi:hypothetical protein H4219_001837 [Mycoemilia scoparia]|uniref:Spc7 kinetochore protein domain-containing protein n=1 Tax=Mycoemilia scoparia TaxID=417184 RepID=A0A9W7ZZ44_9FUNG|nr:hypothetical protein H4219_001837 [Mycoemilia scoparia]